MTQPEGVGDAATLQVGPGADASLPRAQADLADVEAIRVEDVTTSRPRSQHFETLAPLVGDAALLIAFAGLIALANQFTVTVDFLPVPITLVTLAVLVTGAVLGAKRGGLATLLYLGMGLLGAAVHPTGPDAGEHLDAANAGFLLALPVAALVTGWIAYRHATLRTSVSTSWIGLGCLAGMAVIYAIGVPVMVRRLELEGLAIVLETAWSLPFDLAKVGIAMLVAAIVHRIFPRLLRA